jgi:acyl-CoA synthetase (AMP-forming)/AMP-acid ligase II
VGPVDPGDLLAHCGRHLATYKVPEYLAFADELPISALGKLDRRELRALLETETIESNG